MKIFQRQNAQCTNTKADSQAALSMKAIEHLHIALQKNCNIQRARKQHCTLLSHVSHLGSQRSRESNLQDFFQNSVFKVIQATIVFEDHTLRIQNIKCMTI